MANGFVPQLATPSFYPARVVVLPVSRAIDPVQAAATQLVPKVVALPVNRAFARAFITAAQLLPKVVSLSVNRAFARSLIPFVAMPTKQPATPNPPPPGGYGAAALPPAGVPATRTATFYPSYYNFPH